MSVQGDMAMPVPASPGHSSPESFEVEDDSNAISSTDWQLHGQNSPGGTASSSPSTQQLRVAPPLQKRRRVTRACDECRRKKIKCDGKQPCTHCTVYSYECSYDQPSNRRRNPAPQYIEALENRLQRAEALLRTFIPNIDMNDSNFDSIIQQRQASVGDRQAINSGESISDISRPTTSDHGEADQDAQLRSMIETTGQLDLDDSGNWDFHGGSSGTVFLKRMVEQFGGLLGPGTKGAPFLPKPSRPSGPLFGSPMSISDSPLEAGLPNTIDLPSKEVARQLCVSALKGACGLLAFVHGPSFYEMVDRIYDTPPENYGDDENKFLAVLYSVLAVGCLFVVGADGTADAEQYSYKAGHDQGFKYFQASRQILDITECRDIISLQAILFMILFLQSSSNLSTCYSYIGVALRCALRMGLHRNLSGRFNPIERETRRRLFWVIRKMDTYVAALLGLPRLLSDEDIDQELPMEVDDKYITKDAVLPMPIGKLSAFAASNAHTRLMDILAKVIKYIYPTIGVERCVQGAASPSYVISHAKIREVERDLQNWLDKMPMDLRPGGDVPEDLVRVQQQLRMAYAHVQMMLYRPFLHYISRKPPAGKSVDERSYACAAACVSVSRNIVHITTEMQRRGLLTGAYWFTMYTTFFAILSLVFFVLENLDKAGSQEILADANAGRDALKTLAKRSMAADRCTVALSGLFDKLPEKLRRSRTEPLASKKRRSAPVLNPATHREIRGSPDLANQIPSPLSMSQRATTFPTPISLAPQSQTLQGILFDGTQYTPNSLSESTLRRSFHELVSPTDMSAVGTPDSNSTGTSSVPSFKYPQIFGLNNGVPDLGAMMFPSADPFVYPNQPMTEFDNRQQNKNMMGEMLNGSINNQNMFLSTGNNASVPYDNLEGQFFGPLPPYLMQDQQNIDMSQIDMTGMQGLNPQDMNTHTGLTPNVGLNFDDIFAAGNDGWDAMLSEQGYRQ